MCRMFGCRNLHNRKHMRHCSESLGFIWSCSSPIPLLLRLHFLHLRHWQLIFLWLEMNSSTIYLRFSHEGRFLFYFIFFLAFFPFHKEIKTQYHGHYNIHILIKCLYRQKTFKHSVSPAGPRPCPMANCCRKHEDHDGHSLHPLALLIHAVLWVPRLWWHGY